MDRNRNRVQASFIVESASMEAEEITSIMGVAPTHSGMVHKFGADGEDHGKVLRWTYSSEMKVEWDEGTAASEVGHVLDLFEGAREAWTVLAERGAMSVTVRAHAYLRDEHAPWLEFPNSLVKRLADLGVHLSIDITNERDEESRDRVLYLHGLARAEDGDCEGAIELLRQSWAHEPHASTALHIGLLLRVLERPKLAHLWFERAHYSAPTNSKCAAEYAQALHEAGESEEAIEVLQETLRRNPTYGPAKRLLAAIEGPKGE